MCMPYNCECQCPLYLFISLLTVIWWCLDWIFFFTVCKSYTDTVCRAANCYVFCNSSVYEGPRPPSLWPLTGQQASCSWGERKGGAGVVSWRGREKGRPLHTHTVRTPPPTLSLSTHIADWYLLLYVHNKEMRTEKTKRFYWSLCMREEETDLEFFVDPTFMCSFVVHVQFFCAKINAWPCIYASFYVLYDCYWQMSVCYWHLV